MKIWVSRLRGKSLLKRVCREVQTLEQSLRSGSFLLFGLSGGDKRNQLFEGHNLRVRRTELIVQHISDIERTFAIKAAELRRQLLRIDELDRLLAALSTV